MKQPLRVFIIAGELSGDKLGGALLKGLKTKVEVELSGVGGPAMQAEGLNSLFNMSDLSVMGLVEVLPRVPTLLRRVRETAQALDAFQPDVIITIDSPDFCFRVLSKRDKVAKKIPVVHYVAPSVWAWRPERAQKMARYVDHVLALLPFEPPYMEAAGMSCDFVGHPAAYLRQPEVEADFGEGPFMTVLPGSRAGELRRMAPIFAAVLQQVRDIYPDFRFLLPVAAGVERDVRTGFAGLADKIEFIMPDRHDPARSEAIKHAAFQQSLCALATSGTVALELAAARCPMVVAYKANWATTRMVKKLAKIDTANLVNIVTESREIPEFLFENCAIAPVTEAVLTLLADPEARKAQNDAMDQTMIALGRGDEAMPMRAAESVLNFLNA